MGSCGDAVLLGGGVCTETGDVNEEAMCPTACHCDGLVMCSVCGPDGESVWAGVESGCGASYACGPVIGVDSAETLGCFALGCVVTVATEVPVKNLDAEHTEFDVWTISS